MGSVTVRRYVATGFRDQALHPVRGRAKGAVDDATRSAGSGDDPSTSSGSELGEAAYLRDSSRMTTDFEVGVPLTSATESSGTSTFVSG